MAIKQRMANQCAAISGVAMMLLASLAGCHNWMPQAAAPRPSARAARFSPPRLKQNSVVLEIAVVEITAAERADFRLVWPRLDLQAIPLSERILLDRNGLRLGVAGSQLPATLLKLLEPVAGDLGAQYSLAPSTAQLLAQRLRFVEKQWQQIQPLEQHWVGCSAVHSELLWHVVSAEGSERSGTCQQAQFGLVLSVQPSGDGLVRVGLLPEIRFGQLRNRYGVDEDSFLVRAEQERLPLTELETSVALRPGESLLLGATTAGDQLGQQFFAPDSNVDGQRFFLVRVVQTQLDDLFEAGSGSRPLATSTR